MTVATVILCGGKGTHAYPYTTQVPKPLLEVADRPVIAHVMDIYAAQGFTDFVLAAGYQVEKIEEFATRTPGDWKVRVIDTGEDANTGERIEAVRGEVGSTFFATYGDGLGNVDLHALLSRHAAHAGTATMTTVPLPSQYGTVAFDGEGRVQEFLEKPLLDDHFINAGFFAFDQAVFDHWHGRDLEREVLPALGRARQLFVNQHVGFWKSMDTYKDATELTALWSADGAPWLALPERELT